MNVCITVTFIQRLAKFARVTKKCITVALRGRCRRRRRRHSQYYTTNDGQWFRSSSEIVSTHAVGHLTYWPTAVVSFVNRQQTCRNRGITVL